MSIKRKVVGNYDIIYAKWKKFPGGGLRWKSTRVHRFAYMLHVKSDLPPEMHHGSRDFQPWIHVELRRGLQWVYKNNPQRCLHHGDNRHGCHWAILYPAGICRSVGSDGLSMPSVRDELCYGAVIELVNVYDSAHNILHGLFPESLQRTGRH